MKPFTPRIRMFIVDSLHDRPERQRALAEASVKSLGAGEVRAELEFQNLECAVLAQRVERALVPAQRPRAMSAGCALAPPPLPYRPPGTAARPRGSDYALRGRRLANRWRHRARYDGRSSCRQTGPAACAARCRRSMPAGSGITPFPRPR